MTSHNKTAMTEEQKIAYLAEKVMGWTKKVESAAWWCWTSDGKHMVARGVKEVGGFDKPWNPLTDWNHWRQVEEQLGRIDLDSKMSLVLERFIDSFKNDRGFAELHRYIKSDLPTRVDALIQAHSSIAHAD